MSGVRIRGLQVEYLTGGPGNVLFVSTTLYVAVYLSYLLYPYMALPPDNVLYFWSAFKVLLPLSIVYLSVLQITGLAVTIISTLLGVITIIGSIAQLVQFLVRLLVTGEYSLSGVYLSFFIHIIALLVGEVLITVFTMLVRAERREREKLRLQDDEASLRQTTGQDLYIPNSGSVNEMRAQMAREPADASSIEGLRMRATKAGSMGGYGTPAAAASPSSVPLPGDEPGAGTVPPATIGGRVNRFVESFMRHLESRVERFTTDGVPTSGEVGRAVTASGVDWTDVSL